MVKSVKTQVNDLPRTWEVRFTTGQLSEEEYKVLRDLVAAGDSESFLEAARLMDFREREANLESTLKGF